MTTADVEEAPEVAAAELVSVALDLVADSEDFVVLLALVVDLEEVVDLLDFSVELDDLDVLLLLLLPVIFPSKFESKELDFKDLFQKLSFD